MLFLTTNWIIVVQISLLSYYGPWLYFGGFVFKVAFDLPLHAITKSASLLADFHCPRGRF